MVTVGPTQRRQAIPTINLSLSLIHQKLASIMSIGIRKDALVAAFSASEPEINET